MQCICTLPDTVFFNFFFLWANGIFTVDYEYTQRNLRKQVVQNVQWFSVCNTIHGREIKVIAICWFDSMPLYYKFFVFFQKSSLLST